VQSPGTAYNGLGSKPAARAAKKVAGRLAASEMQPVPMHSMLR